MSRRQTVGDLRGHPEGLIEPERPPLEPCGKRLAVEQFHDEVVGVAFAADVVQGADVRMIERRDRARLALEPVAHLGVVGEMRREDLHRDVAPEPRVLRPVDLAHAAGTERADDLVGT